MHGDRRRNPADLHRAHGPSPADHRAFKVTPSTQTTYQAKTSTQTGPPLTIKVHPRVGLGFQNHTFSTKVTGGSDSTSFAGKIVYFQRRTASGGWVTLEKVV